MNRKQVKECSTVGYHSTKSENAASILSSRKFIASESNHVEIRGLDLDKNHYHWLGKGVYFWERDMGSAKLWAKNQEGSVILKCTISYDEKESFNLLNYKCWQMINRFIDAILDDEEIIATTNKGRNRLIGLACDLVFETGTNHNYKMIMYAFNNESKETAYLPKLTNQICVKNDCIVDYDSLCYAY